MKLDNSATLGPASRMLARWFDSMTIHFATSRWAPTTYLCNVFINLFDYIASSGRKTHLKRFIFFASWTAKNSVTCKTSSWETAFSSFLWPSLSCVTFGSIFTRSRRNKAQFTFGLDILTSNVSDCYFSTPSCSINRSDPIVFWRSARQWVFHR